MSTVVHTQAELDAAIASGATGIVIDSPTGLWLTVAGSSSVVAGGSSSVVAGGSSRVEAWDSSRVVAWGSSSVEARGSSSVVARGSSSVVAGGSSRVVAWESSRVEARGSSSVEAWDSSRVVAWGSSSVEAGKYVAVHLHSQAVTLSGGVVIDMTAIDRSDPQSWVDLCGGKVRDGWLTVYKGVDGELRSAYGTKYPVGATVTADDWLPTEECGRGLHFSPSPSATHTYCAPERYLECEVELAGIMQLGDKIKARSCRVVREVDRWGDPIGATS